MAKFFATIDGIKRAAKKLARERVVPHHQALDEISREAGFQNYVHASRAYAERVVEPRYAVVIHKNWRETPTRYGGTEKLRITLSQPLTALLKPHHFTGYLSGSTIVEDNQLVGNYRYDDRERARREGCKVARVLQFMEVTGLIPTDAYKAYPKGRFDNRIPGADHHHNWYHPATRSYVMSDEPYPGQTTHYDEQRSAWQTRFDYDLVRVNWGSIYGLGTELWLSAKRGGPLDVAEICRRLEASEPAVETTDWPQLQVV